MWMNILMVLENPYPPDERVENEINILTKNGFQITLVCTKRGGNSDRREGEPYHIQNTNFKVHL